MAKQLWFRRKWYGWGWYPITWQGWAVVAAYVILLYYSILKLDHEWLKNVIVVLIFTGILLWICFKKGEKPRWQWGKPAKKKSK